MDEILDRKWNPKDGGTLDFKLKKFILKKVSLSNYEIPILVVVRSKPWVCGHLIAGIAPSNPADVMAACLLCLLCVVWVAFFAAS